MKVTNENIQLRYYVCMYVEQVLRSGQSKQKWMKKVWKDYGRRCLRKQIKLCDPGQ